MKTGKTLQDLARELDRLFTAMPRDIWQTINEGCAYE